MQKFQRRFSSSSFQRKSCEVRVAGRERERCKTVPSFVSIASIESSTSPTVPCLALDLKPCPTSLALDLQALHCISKLSDASPSPLHCISKLSDASPARQCIPNCIPKPFIAPPSLHRQAGYWAILSLSKPFSVADGTPKSAQLCQAAFVVLSPRR